MRKYLWFQHMSVRAIIGLVCLLALAACDLPTINQKATPTTIQSSRTSPSPSPPTLTPSATSAVPPTTGNVALVYDDQMGGVLLLGDTFYSDPTQP
ncbi:MAG TPA: hypothetical protein VKX46_16895, partial [Ktedonobacteraceae bacterium]|nr:hypothetical protein [Ktedonobacteraceae bacterium]